MERGRTDKKPASKRLAFTHHSGHPNHLCTLVSQRRMDRVARLAKGAAYLCYLCGRSAASVDNLCEPIEM